MRPVAKKRVGECIVLKDGTMHTVQEDYKPYGKARPVLLANLGNYCSYCEDVFHSGTNLQTEHIQPKGLDVSGVKPYQELSTKWDNFLLGCATCNGKGNKGDKDVHLNDIHLPHRNNTYLSLLYKEAGVVIYTVGIGTPQGAPITIDGETMKDENGQIVVSKLDEQTLQQIAVLTGGSYVRASERSVGLDEILRQINQMEKKEFTSMAFAEYNDQFHYLLAAALAILLFEFLMIDRKNRLLARISVFKS